jgi:hypothetical protein
MPDGRHRNARLPDPIWIFRLKMDKLAVERFLDYRENIPEISPKRPDETP